MKNPRVSVIIPTKNEGKVLDACLSSLDQQKTNAPFEIIIVDTKSTDQTISIAKKHNTVVVAESRPGRNIAHQKGFETASGEILCFTEADCILPNTWIDAYVSAFKTFSDADAFVGRYIFHNASSPLTHASRLLQPVFDRLFRIIHGHYAFRASNFAIKKKSLERIGGFNMNAREFDDVELSMRLAKNGCIRYLPRPIISTGDRRVRGRIGSYVREAMTNYFRVCILKQTVSDKVFADIR